MTASIPGKFLSRLTALNLPRPTLEKVIHIFLAFIEHRDGKPPKANGHAIEPSLSGIGPDPWPSDYVDQFWDPETGYPRRVGKANAIRNLQRIEKSGTTSFEAIMVGVSRFRNATRMTAMNYIPYPATWLNDGRWLDDPRAVAEGGKLTQNPDKNGYTAILREMHNGSGPDHETDFGSDVGDAGEGHGSHRRIL